MLPAIQRGGCSGFMDKKAECIAFANYKGGTGKTTSCLAIAGYLAKNGYKTLVVDLDPQANATSGLGIDLMMLKLTMYDVLLGFCDGYDVAPITAIVLETGFENLHLAPSEFDLGVAEVMLHQTENRFLILEAALNETRKCYDFILLDLPSNSGLLTLNGLCAADRLFVPLDPSIYSLEALDNLKATFRDIRRMGGLSIERISAILNRYVRSGLFRRRSPSQELEARLRDMFDEVYVIPEGSEVYGSQRSGTPMSHYAPKSSMGRAYKEIAKNIILQTINES
jgi:chromosome partitioning protein